jgi:ABC-2 type transport system permease protein
MARAEVLLLRRNRTLLFNAVLLPLGVVGLLAVLGEAVLVVGAGDVVAALFSALLLFVVFYTVLSTVVARRDLGVLLRLRTGESATRRSSRPSARQRWPWRSRRR